MDYKRIIKSPLVRERILHFLSFIPDKSMIKIQYRIKTGRRLNLDNPKRYSEKIQWYKLYCRMPLMRTVADKSKVKDYVVKMGLSGILIPTVSIYDSLDQIKVEDFPSKFVAKDTLGGGGRSVFVCQDKKSLNEIEFKKLAKSWLDKSRSYKGGGREWVYGGKHRVLVEKYLEHDSDIGLIDYKFFCFNSKVECLYVISNRVIGKSAELGIYDKDFKKIEAYRADEKPAKYTVQKPKNYEKMIAIAEKLSKPFPYARVDLYNIDGEIYFGEITLTDGSGYFSFEPDSFDYYLGEKFILPEVRKNDGK